MYLSQEKSFWRFHWRFKLTFYGVLRGIKIFWFLGLRPIGTPNSSNSFFLAFKSKLLIGISSFVK